ncbi:hypothetical protein Tco_0940205, partial [Tanacetum coccineum]
QKILESPWGSPIPFGDGDGDVNRFPDGDEDGDGDEAKKRGWGWSLKDLEEDPEEDPEEEPEEDVDVKLEDDAELIFPYEVEGYKTLPPGDVSFDSVSSNSESEDEEVGESSSARDSSHVDGLAPWALRHDLEASRARARVMEAELGTCQTEIALLKSKDKIREKEIELLNHDLENVERALGNVLERMSVLENGDNVTLKKRLAETETKLVWARMECETAERRLHESRVWNKMFYLDMVHIGLFRSRHLMMRIPSVQERNRRTYFNGDRRDFRARGPPSTLRSCRQKLCLRHCGATGGAEAGGAKAGGAGVGGARSAAPEITRCTYITFMKCDPHPFKGTEGVVGLCLALTWWNGRIASMGIDAANSTPWTEVRKWICMTEEFCLGSVFAKAILEQELMVEPEQVKVEQYIHGLSNNIRGDVTSSKPANIVEAVCKGDRGGRGDNRRDYNRWQNQRRANAGAMTNVAPNDNEVCPK